MTTTTFDAAAQGSARSWARLLSPLGGLGLVAGLIALFLTPAGDDAGETPAEVVAYASAHEGWSAAGACSGSLDRPRRPVRRRAPRPPAGHRDRNRVDARPDRRHHVHALLRAHVDDLDRPARRHADDHARALARRRRISASTTSRGSRSARRASAPR